MFVNASLILFGYLFHFVDLLIIQEDEGSFCVRLASSLLLYLASWQVLSYETFIHLTYQ